MAKSTIKIENDMYLALAGTLTNIIGGTFYRRGTRPIESKDEDAVLTVSTASAEQIQTGRARLNIYVQNIDCGFKSLVPNTQRIEEIAAKDEEIVKVLNDSYIGFNFWLSQSTGMIAVPDKPEHFVNMTIDFQQNELTKE